MAATEPDNPRDDGHNAMQLKCSPIWEPRGLCQNDDYTSSRLWAPGARLEKLEISRAKVVAAPLDKLTHVVCS